MNTNKKISRFLVVVFSAVLTVVFSRNSFCDCNDGLDSRGIVIKIDENPINPKVITFKKPGNQRITIENRLSKDVDVGHMFFIGDDFTAPLVARGISLIGSSGCSTIKAGTSCDFIINASDNASATISPDGEVLLFNYRVAGEQKDNFVQFKFIIDYNNYIVFSKRNLEFTEYYSCFHGIETYIWGDENTKPLTLTNSNSENSIYIRGAKAAREGVTIDYKNCSRLDSGESCTMNVTVTHKAKQDAIPIFITYDVYDGGIMKKDLVAVAAASINFSKTQTQVVDAGVNSALTTGVIYQTLFPNSPVTTLTRSIFAVIIPNQQAQQWATNTFTGMIAGVGYGAVGPNYDRSSNINAVAFATVMHLILGGITCGKEHRAACITATVGCGMLSTLGNKFITDIIFSNVVHKLPEQRWMPWLKDEAKRLVSMPFSFAATATVRVLCKDFFNIPNGGLAEIYTDLISGSTMVGVNEIKALFPSANINNFDSFRNNTLFSQRSCDDCTCRDLKYDRIPTIDNVDINFTSYVGPSDPHEVYLGENIIKS